MTFFFSEIILPKKEPPKKSKIKPPQTAQIMQMEDPADFVPTIVPDQPPREKSKKVVRSETFEKPTETPAPPSIERVPTPIVNRSDTFVSKVEERPPSATIPRSDTFVSKIEERPPSASIPQSETFASKNEEMPPSAPITRSDTFVSKNENLTPEIDNKPETPPLPVEIQPEYKPDIDKKETMVENPRVATPPKMSVEGKHPIKAIYSFLNEARRWAQQTRDTTYSNLMLSTEELRQHLPSRKAGGTLRKLPDIDTQILIKAAKNQAPKDIHYLLLEQLLTPCSLSLIGSTYPNLTHLTLRQCKLVQLTGLETCSSLTILDVEVNIIFVF